MKIIVLGAGAGGGSPQWNSNSFACSQSRLKNPTFQDMTQCSIAFSKDGIKWFIVNASPDIRQQINRTEELWPNPTGPIRNSPIEAVILTNGEIDSISGLLTLREQHYFSLYATESIHDLLKKNSIFKVLTEDRVQRCILEINSSIHVDDDICITVFSVLGASPLYDRTGNSLESSELTVGLIIEHESKKIVFVPACAGLTSSLKQSIEKCDLLLCDGTFWSENEMNDAGASNKSAKEMGHIAINDKNGFLYLDEGLEIKSKYFIHINNTNPILYNNEIYNCVKAKGWRKAYDGLRIDL